MNLTQIYMYMYAFTQTLLLAIYICESLNLDEWLKSMTKRPKVSEETKIKQ